MIASCMTSSTIHPAGSQPSGLKPDIFPPGTPERLKRQLNFQTQFQNRQVKLIRRTTSKETILKLQVIYVLSLDKCYVEN